MIFLHTRLRVSDMDATIKFYTLLGFVLTRQSISPQGNKLSYLEIQGSSHQLELCWSPEYQVNVPEDLIHTCVGVEDIISYCARLEEAGVEIWPEHWRSTFAEGGLKMAFVTDPDGYEVEILEEHK